MISFLAISEEDGMQEYKISFNFELKVDIVHVLNLDLLVH
jgi:hypothetical protein